MSKKTVAHEISDQDSKKTVAHEMSDQESKKTVAHEMSDQEDSDSQKTIPFEESDQESDQEAAPPWVALRCALFSRNPWVALREVRLQKPDRPVREAPLLGNRRRSPRHSED